jgi:hypothetical protein
MNTTFADVLYVVTATKNGQSEFWAAATPRRVAAAQVQRSLPPGWKAIVTSWRLSRGRAAELEMRTNTVRKLTEASSSQLLIGQSIGPSWRLTRAAGCFAALLCLITAIFSSDGTFIFTFSTAAIGPHRKVGKCRFCLGSVQALSPLQLGFAFEPCLVLKTVVAR